MLTKLSFYLFYLLTFSIIKSGIVKTIDESFEEKLKYENIDYLKAYKISNSIISYKSNGNSKVPQDLSFAFDDDFSTFWQSLQYQQDSFLNDIQITFSKTVTIDRMVYQAPNFPAIKGFGYPTELKVYYKLRRQDGTLSDEDTDFLLIDDIISETTGSKVLFIFDQEIRCDQIKLEWASIENTGIDFSYALANEIILLFPENEYINKILFDVFEPNDYSYLLIKSKYNKMNIIEEIEDNINEYIDISHNLKNFIDRIKSVIKGDIKYDPKREFTTNQSAEMNIIKQHGNIAEYSTETLYMSRGGTNRQPTGISAYSNETLIIYVDSNDNDRLPLIRFSQYIGNYSNWLSMPYKLQKGKNIFQVPEFNISGIRVKLKPGGPIYIENKYLSNEQSQKIRIYFEGGNLFPFFTLNDDVQIFKKFLNNYILEYNKNGLLYNVVELYSENVIITWNATDADKMYNIQGESPQDNLITWDKLMRIFFIFNGIQFEENQPYYDINNQYITIHIRYSNTQDKGSSGYAYENHIGIFKEDNYNFIFASYKEIGHTLPHEIGHMIDVYPREYEEKTNMMVEEFAFQVLYNHIYNRTGYEVIYKYIAPDYMDNLKRHCLSNICKGFFVNVGTYAWAHYVWWDLECFNHGYWGKLNNLYRYNLSLAEGMNKNEIMVYFSSLILGFDTGYYFERFGLGMENTPFNNSQTSEFYKKSMEKAIGEGKISNKTIIKKFWYADNKQYNFSLIDGTGCYDDKNEYNIKIVNITKDNSTQNYNISLPYIDCKGHLGFEIIENGIIIGFTNKLYYVDTLQYPNEYTPKYKIVAYDRLLNHKNSN